MTHLHKSIVILFLCFISQQGYCQSYKFTTSGLSVLEKNEKGKWGQWSDLDLVNIVVSLDTNKNRIVIYSQIVQLFEIVAYQDIVETDTDIIYSFVCKDIIGDDCTLSFITRKKQDNRKQLYLNYDRKIIVYNIFNM
ncbi:hypothetical protein [Flavobacterium restrictum]|uniref:Uncharacterized protein n=1 Tax=Flavobacterium restrictum TaxID=2594428 RepID=A0A553E424_9FLAO|nr:hypothetical protein [Flavobacterium restrictum]TRX39777.1 hypothetical protein FNW21_08715 [Flavobacterium restrictum]